MEVRSNFDNAKGSYITELRSKILKSKKCKNIDLFVILFCVNKNDKSIYQKLNIAISELEQIKSNDFLYIPPENLLDFFKDIKFDH